MFLTAQNTPPLGWGCALKGNLAPPDFPLTGRAGRGCHSPLGKDKVLMQAPSHREKVERDKIFSVIFFCISFPLQHMEGKNEANPDRGSPGLSPALPYVIFNFPGDTGAEQGMKEVRHWNSGPEMQLRSLLTVILRLNKVSSGSGRTQSSEHISTRQDPLSKETPRLLWLYFLAAVCGFGHNPIVTITINHIPIISLQSTREGFPEQINC